MFPVPISEICANFICNTHLADIFSFKEKLENFVADIAIPRIFGIGEFTTRAHKIPCDLAKFPNLFVFIDREFYFFPLSLCSLCSGDPMNCIWTEMVFSYGH